MWFEPALGKILCGDFEYWSEREIPGKRNYMVERSGTTTKVRVQSDFHPVRGEMFIERAAMILRLRSKERSGS
jgi:hypothetical protein